jgi:8-oxo-dGTP pyrophosphatase MutT (NUDIX family)
MVQQKAVEMTLSDLESHLRSALAAPLPGAEAQRRMAPTPRPGWRSGRSPDESRHAAGLVLLFPIETRVHVLLTVRSSRLPNHAGQVSLPGGAVEAGESFEQAALRETHEETGVDPASVRVLGRLTPLHIPVSGFMLHPVVGISDIRPTYRLADSEVDRLVEPSLDQLLDPACVRRDSGLWDGVARQVPYFALDDLVVWGATAMVLAEFIQLAARQG